MTPNRTKHPPRSRFGKRLAVSLAVLVPVALLWGIKNMASWRPQRLAVGGTTQSGNYTTVNLGSLEGVFNSHLFFLPTADQYEQEEPFLRILDINGQVNQTKLSSVQGDAAVQALSDTKAIIWDTQWPSQTGKDNAKMAGQIFDCQAMRSLKKLQEVTLDENTLESNFTDAKAIATGNTLVFATQFDAMEWSLNSGHLLHHWKLRKTGDDQYLTQTTYAPRTNTFVQIMKDHLRVWDAKTGHLIHTSAKALANFDLVYGEGDPPNGVDFSPNGDLVVYTTVLPNGSDGPLSVARCDTAQTLWQMQDPNYSGYVRFSPDGREMYAYSDKKGIFTVREASTGRVLRRLQSPPNVNWFSITPDGNHLCSSCAGAIWWQRAR